MTADRLPLPYDPKLVRQALQKRIWDLLARLNLRDEMTRDGVSQNADRIFPKSPLRADRKAGSFVVWTDSGREGAWKDYAVSSHHGDVYGLIQAVERLEDWIDAYWWALDFLGWERRGSQASPRTKAVMRQEQERRAAEAAAEASRQVADAEAKSSGLFKFWLGCAPLIGSPAEHYLRHARGIPLERLAKPPEAIRWAELYEHVDADGEVHEWRDVMVTAMTRGKRLAALHFTFLKPDGSGKAGRRKDKLIVGPAKGAAIRLARGPTGLNPREAAKAGRRGVLAIGEGIETCLTVAVARPDYRVWAAGSLSLMDGFEWPPCASAVVLLGENDASQGAAEGFARVHRYWEGRAKGRALHVAASSRGSDFNDMAKAS